MKSRWPVHASLLGLGVASSLAAGVGCASLVGDFTLGAGTGGSGGSGSSMTGSSANSSASTSASTSGGGATASSSVAVVSTSPSATSSSSSSSGELDSGYHTCTPLVGGFPDETCTGVFVSSSLGSDAGTATGTMANPYATIGAALASVAQGTPLTLYVCAENFSEGLSGTGNVTMYGGLDCQNGWQYTATPTTLNGPANSPAVTFTTGPTVIEGFAITGGAPSSPGGSSIGMAFGGSSLTLTNVSITASPGVQGADGPPQSTPANPGSPGGSPSSGTTCSGGAIAGGLAGENFSCSTQNGGGSGGSGRATSPASNGSPGQPGSAIVAPVGGTGQAGGGSCSPGTNGPSADNGNPGIPATSLGTLTSTGYTGPSASIGAPGGDGPGGGGGGGAIGCAADGGAGSGGAGGGGGAGGCGGLPGNFGLPGGSSLGLILSGSSVPTLTLMGVTITTANGGNGGTGAAGQAGGQGGKPGDGSGEACNGGSGGNGGNGGNGPGGAGGHSIAIALTTALLSPAPAGVTVMLGLAGKGGAGSNAQGGPKGPKGIACTVMSFAGSPAAGAACTIQ